MTNKMFFFAGPTACGKTDYSIKFAEKNNCEILSCDSASFYKFMDIGTAKPSKREQSIIKHWGLDIIYPNEYFSVKDYSKYAENCVYNILNRNKNVLVVGGSGFYMQSFFEPITDDISPSIDTINFVENLYSKSGIAGCLSELYKYNENGLPKNFNIKNPLKIKKALARCVETGSSIEILLKNLSVQKNPFDSIKKEIFLLTRSIEILRLRVKMRVDKMFANGLINEVSSLLKSGYLVKGTSAYNSIGYREVIDFLNGKQNYESCKEQIIANTFCLIKKQNTWFRNKLRDYKYSYL